MIQITSPLRFILFVLGLAVLVSVVVFWVVWDGATIQKSGQFEITEGQSARIVWQGLVEQEFAARVLPFRYHGWRQKAAPNIQAGVYQLERGEQAAEIVQRFIAGDVTPSELTVTYPEGFTLEQIAARTAARGIGSEQDFVATAVPVDFTDQFSFLENLPGGRSLEGYLFPDTYQVFPDDSPSDVIQRMLANFDGKLTPDLRLAAAERNRTLDEIVIMASIIEREVLTDGDMTVVAGILWKRLADGVGLDADATVRYALNKWDGALTVNDLAIDSPYNTRKYRGLPPGPISNPGLRAIVAAIEPQESEFYYYLSASSGETVFSRTNEEHNENKARYLR
jgi:UPF0755 protein